MISKYYCGLEYGSIANKRLLRNCLGVSEEGKHHPVTPVSQKFKYIFMHYNHFHLNMK